MSTWLISTNGLLLTAGNGLPSVGATPPPVATASAEITVSKRLVTATAPDAVVFEITNISGFDTLDTSGGGVIYNPQFHELYYFWDFGDTTYSSWTAPTRVRSEHKNANVGWGPWGRHVYRNAGSYSPKCTIYEPSSGKFAVAYLNSASADSGTAGTATAAIDVADPDTTFSGTNTIFMSPSGSFSNAPSGATTVTSADIDAVIGSNIAGQEATPKRLMLNRGEIYTLSGYTLGFSTDFPTLHIVAGGDAGADPYVSASQGFMWDDNQTATSGGNTKDFIVQGIEWDGGADPTVSAADPGDTYLFSHAFDELNRAATVLFDGCTIYGFNTIFQNNNDESAPRQPSHFAVVDCSISDWYSAGSTLMGSDYTSLLGSSWKCQPDALADAGRNLGTPFRSGASQFVIHGNDWFTRLHWTTESKGALQPCLRVNSEATEGCESYIVGNVFEGGNECINYTQSAASSTVGECNHINDKNFYLAMPETGKFISIQQAAITIRNNIFVRPEMVSGSGMSPITCEYYNGGGGGGGDTDTQNAPIRVYSNHFVNYFYDASMGTLVQNLSTFGATFNDVSSQNNILHEPNLSSGATDLSLASTSNDFLPINIGYRDTSTALVDEEATPHSVIDFDAQTAAFTAGETLTGGTSGATATISTVIDNGTTGTIYLGAILNGPFLNNETITDGAGGSATANGGSRDAGFTDNQIPLTGSSVIGAYTTGKVAYDDFYGNIRDTVLSGLTRSTYSTGAHEPSLES